MILYLPSFEWYLHCSCASCSLPLAALRTRYGRTVILIGQCVQEWVEATVNDRAQVREQFCDFEYFFIRAAQIRHIAEDPNSIDDIAGMVHSPAQDKWYDDWHHESKSSESLPILSARTISSGRHPRRFHDATSEHGAQKKRIAAYYNNAWDGVGGDDKVIAKLPAIFEDL